MKKTKEEIEAMIEQAIEDKRDLSGMTYQEGVRNALDWVLGELGDDSPLD